MRGWMRNLAGREAAPGVCAAPVYVVALCAVMLGAGGAGCARCGSDPPRPGAPPSGVSRTPSVVPSAPVVGPSVLVGVTGEGFAAPEVEALIVTPVESRLLAVPGVARVTSESSDSHGRIVVTFGPGTTDDEAQVRVADAVRDVPLPEDADPAWVSVAHAVTALDAVISAPDEVSVPPGALRSGVRELTRLPGVASAEICGVDSPELHVDIDERRLRSYGVTAADVEAALRQGLVASVSSRGGGAEGDGALIRTRNPSAFVELGRAVIAQKDGVVLRLADLATITYGRAPTSCACLRGGAPAACVRVSAGPGYSPASIRARAAKELTEFVERLGPGWRVEFRPIDEAVVELGPTAGSRSPDEVAAGLRGPLAGAFPGRRWTLLVSADSTTLAVEGADLEEVLAAPDVAQGLSPSPVGRGDVVLRIEGEALDRLHALGEAVGTALEARQDVLAVRREGVTEQPELRVGVDRERSAALGLQVTDVTRAVTTALHGGRVVAETIGPDGPVPLRLTIGGPARDPGRLAKLTLPLPSGGAVPLGEVATIEAVLTPASISHHDGRRVVRVHVWGSRDAVSFTPDAILKAVSGTVELAAGERIVIEKGSDSPI